MSNKTLRFQQSCTDSNPLCGRFYMGSEGTAKIRMVDAEFDYTYEYQGNAAKLVHTPLTDKCYLTLTQVLGC